MVVSALFVAACGGGEEEAPAEAVTVADVDPSSPEVDQVTVAGYPNAGTTPLFVAQSQNILDEYGLEVELQPAPNAPAMLAQMVSGDVPIGQVNAWFAVPAIQQGADLRVIGEVIRGSEGLQTVEVLPDSGIDGLEDLEGKKVAVVGLNSGHQGRIASAMLAEGLDPSQVEFVSLGWNEMPAALEQGNVDAVTVTGPAQLQVQTEFGSRAILDIGAGQFEEFPEAQWLVSAQWAEENPNTVAAFQCAVVLRGQELVTEDQQVYEDTLRELGYSEEAIQADVKPIFPAANEPPQIIPDIMYEMEWITEEFDISEITIPLPDNC
ncbi:MULTISPECIES: ABC transporter substrate-binding protein [unclassified Modestobacter]